MPEPTRDQRIARLQDEVARLIKGERRTDTARKVIAGVVALTEAEQNPAFAKLLLDLADKHLVRPVDRQRWKPFADKLREAHGVADVSQPVADVSR